MHADGVAGCGGASPEQPGKRSQLSGGGVGMGLDGTQRRKVAVRGVNLALNLFGAFGKLAIAACPVEGVFASATA